MAEVIAMIAELYDKVQRLLKWFPVTTGSFASSVYATTAEIANVADTESAGTSPTVARGDHVHDLTDGMVLNVHVGAAADIAMTKLQPYEFHAYNSATDADVTGDGTAYTVQFDTELWTSAEYDGTATYTAPITGRYDFEASVLFLEVGASHNSALIELVTSNRTYRGDQIHLGNVRTSGNVSVLAICVQAADMDANDTAQIRVTVSGSTKTLDVFGTTFPVTHFSGKQVA